MGAMPAYFDVWVVAIDIFTFLSIAAAEISIGMDERSGLLYSESAFLFDFIAIWIV